MPDKEEDIVCQNAVTAAFNKVQEKCGGKGKLSKLSGGVLVWVPSNPPPGDPDPEGSKGLSCEDRILAVAQSDWAYNEARGLATKMFGMKKSDKGYQKAVRRAAIEVAEGAVPGCEGKVDVAKVLDRWS